MASIELAVPRIVNRERISLPSAIESYPFIR